MSVFLERGSLMRKTLLVVGTRLLPALYQFKFSPFLPSSLITFLLDYIWSLLSGLMCFLLVFNYFKSSRFHQLDNFVLFRGAKFYERYVSFEIKIPDYIEKSHPKIINVCQIITLSRSFKQNKNCFCLFWLV